MDRGESFLDHDIGLEEFITGNRFIDACDRTGAVFCKTDHVSELSHEVVRVLVTHNSDCHVNSARLALRPRGVRRWFAQNKAVASELVQGIPIGLENRRLRVSPAARGGRFSSEVHGAALKARRIEELRQADPRKRRLAYLNATVETFPDERLPLRELARRLPWLTTRSRLPMGRYYEDVATHRFVICPRGNGTDCHRVWEALYLRAVPVVLASTTMDEFRDLPILFLGSWEQLDRRFLQERYEELVARRYDLGKMRMSYWEARIAAAVREAA